MGRIGKHIKAEIKKYIEQTVETRLKYNQRAFTFASSGDDSPPLKDDRILLVSIDGTGKYAACGVLTVSQGAKAGEKILFSRNEDNEVQAILSLLNDGKVKLETPEEISISTQKNMNIETEEKIEVLAKEMMTLKTQMLKLTGGSLEVNGSVAATGSGPFCAITHCHYDGAPHVGTTVSGT